MIKKYLFGLGIAFLGFLGFSSANGGVYEIGVNSFNSKLNNDYSISVLKGGSFITNYLGNGKGLFGLDSSYLVWWDTDGLLYGYYSGVTSIYQGNFSNYMICDELTSTGNLILSHCNNYSISGNVGNDLKLVFSNFFNQVIQGDYFGYDYSNGPSITLCWSSRSLGKTMCFIRNTIDYPFFNNKSYNGLTFLNFQANLIGIAPGQNGYGGDYSGSGNIADSSSQGDNVSVGGNVVYGNCTNGQALQWYRNYIGINDFVCYGGLDSFDYYSGDYTVIPGKGLTVFDLYEYENFNGFYSGFNDWLQTRSYNYTQYINGDSNTTFDSDPTVFKTYFGILYRTFGPAREVHDYCRLLINSDLNGNLRDNPYIPSNVKNELCENIVNNDTVENPGQSSNESGTIVSSDWSGIGNTNNSGSNLSGGTPVYDGTNFINTYFNKLKGNSSNPEGTGNGIIPGYIIVALMGVIFFKFLRK